MPLKIFETYVKEGKPAAMLEKGVAQAEDVLRDLGAVGISIDEATSQLETEGAEKFGKPYESLLETLSKVRTDLGRDPKQSGTIIVPGLFLEC